MRRLALGRLAALGWGGACGKYRQQGHRCGGERDERRQKGFFYHHPKIPSLPALLYGHRMSVPSTARDSAGSRSEQLCLLYRRFYLSLVANGRDKAGFSVARVSGKYTPGSPGRWRTTCRDSFRPLPGWVRSATRAVMVVRSPIRRISCLFCVLSVGQVLDCEDAKLEGRSLTWVTSAPGSRLLDHVSRRTLAVAAEIYPDICTLASCDYCVGMKSA